MNDMQVYRVRESRSHPDRAVRKAWYGKTWQAEWDMCPWCPRAYTERGVRRQGRRRMAWPINRQLAYARRRIWLRSHVTQRFDPFYSALRKAN